MVFKLKLNYFIKVWNDFNLARCQPCEIYQKLEILLL
jgi:hypothetical protein